MLKNIRLGHSPLTDSVYVGYLNADRQTWRDKIDLTNDFLAAVISRWAGCTQTIRGGGKHYEITVREVPVAARKKRR